MSKNICKLLSICLLSSMVGLGNSVYASETDNENEWTEHTSEIDSDNESFVSFDCIAFDNPKNYYKNTPRALWLFRNDEKKSWFHEYNTKTVSSKTHPTFLTLSVFLDWCIKLFEDVKKYEYEYGVKLGNIGKYNVLMEPINTSKKHVRYFWRIKWQPVIVISSDHQENQNGDESPSYDVLAKLFNEYIMKYVKHSGWDMHTTENHIETTKKLLNLIINKYEGYNDINDIIESFKVLKNQAGHKGCFTGLTKTQELNLLDEINKDYDKMKKS